jgi:hypothetical protein
VVKKERVLRVCGGEFGKKKERKRDGKMDENGGRKIGENGERRKGIIGDKEKGKMAGRGMRDRGPGLVAGRGQGCR